MYICMCGKDTLRLRMYMESLSLSIRKESIMKKLFLYDSRCYCTNEVIFSLASVVWSVCLFRSLRRFKTDLDKTQIQGWPREFFQ